MSWRQSDYNSPKNRVYVTPQYPRGLPWMPWIELKPDREISTRMLGSLTKYFPMARRAAPRPASASRVFITCDRVPPKPR